MLPTFRRSKKRGKKKPTQVHKDLQRSLMVHKGPQWSSKVQKGPNGPKGPQRSKRVLNQDNLYVPKVKENVHKVYEGQQRSTQVNKGIKV